MAYGVRHPTRPDRSAVVIEAVGPLALATSAAYERGAHIVDPRTGAAPTTLLSATVVGPDLTFVDAYATVLYVMGLDGLGWIDAHEGFGAYAITAEAMTYSTPTFDRYRADGDVAA